MTNVTTARNLFVYNYLIDNKLILRGDKIDFKNG